MTLVTAGGNNSKENLSLELDNEDEEDDLLMYLLEKLRDVEPIADGVYVIGIDTLRCQIILEIMVGKEKRRARAKSNFTFYIRNGVAEFIIEDYPKREFAKGVYIKVYMGQRYSIKNTGKGKLELAVSPRRDRIEWYSA